MLWILLLAPPLILHCYCNMRRLSKLSDTILFTMKFMSNDQIMRLNIKKSYASLGRSYLKFWDFNLAKHIILDEELDKD